MSKKTHVIRTEIPDDIHRRVKALAALRGETLKDLTARLYREWVERAEAEMTREKQADAKQ